MVMAPREHSCTRRALLGAAVGGVPALTLPALTGRAPPSPQMGEGDLRGWTRALAELVWAEAEMLEFGKRSRGKARSFEAQCAVDEAFSDRVVLFNRALERLMSVPAPDLPALSLKVALAVDEQAWELPDGEACMARLKDDARRLAAAHG